METALRLLLTNAATAAALAAVALVASRAVRRPAVAHALWLLALVKLVTPPLVPLPLLPAWRGLPELSVPGSPLVVRMGPETAPAPGAATSPPTKLPGGPASAGAAPLELAPAPPGRAPEPRGGDATLPTSAAGWGLLVALGLAVGAVTVLALAAWRFARFHRLLACAEPAPPAITERAQALAGQLGLRRAPPVLVVRARIPPMLWPEPSGPRLLLPRDLLRQLTEPERDALVAHELAHVRRRDHWVRLVEMLATALFWWYPLTWWARAGLRRAEERCCDEWVLRVLPRSAEAYAEGLLKSLTFVSSAPAPVSALASGASPLYELETRLKEILMSRPAPHLAAPFRLALLAAAAASLAVFPTHAREQESPRTATPEAASALSTRPALAAAPALAAPPLAAPVQTGAPALAGAATLATAPALAPAPLAAPLLAQAPSPAGAPALALAAQPSPQTRGAQDARRALEEQRRALEAKQRELHQQELELHRQEIELRASAEKAELRAAAERLRVEGRTAEAERCEKRLELTDRRMQLEQKRLGFDAQRLALEMKLEAQERAQRDRAAALEAAGDARAMADVQRAMERAEAEHRRAAQELEQKHREFELEARTMEREMQRLHAEEQIHAMGEATEEMARALARQLEALKAALGETGSRADVEREMKRLEAALEALRADPGPASSGRMTPRPTPQP